jgi:hypothetical protein
MKHLMLYEDWCAAGQLTPDHQQIDEQVSWSDALHLVGDVAAAAADMVVPGSGAVIDVTNLLAYLVESHLATDQNEKAKLAISAVIQAFAIFDPLNIISATKIGLNSIFRAFTQRTPQAIQTARLAAASVEVGLTTMKNGLIRLAGTMATRLADSKFGSAIAWVSKKLGIPNVLAWLKTFLTQTVPNLITTFLTKLRNTFNPAQTGARNMDELGELLLKTSAKFITGQAIQNNIKTAYADLFNQRTATANSTYTEPTRIYADNTRVVQNYRIPGLK